MRPRSRILSSELVKLLTLRSVQIVLAATVVTALALAAVVAPSVREAILSNSPALAAGVVPEDVGFEVVGLCLVGPIVLGIVAGSSEYQSGQLKTSLIAAPRRIRLIAAKAAALFLVTLVLGLVTIPSESLICQFLLGDLSVVQNGIPLSLALRWLGGIASWAAVAQIGFALAVILRQALVPLLVMILMSQLTLVMVHLVPGAQYLPFSAGVQLFDPSSIISETPSAALSPFSACAALIAWVAGLTVVSFTLFKRRGIQS